MTETQEFFYITITMLVMTTITSYILNRALFYHLERSTIALTPEQKKDFKWAISSIVTILTGHFYLLYLLLLR